jgi:hypothetical protein
MLLGILTYPAERKQGAFKTGRKARTIKHGDVVISQMYYGRLSLSFQ